MKTYVTRGELLGIINQVMARDCAHCEDCEVVGPVWHLQRPEADGANWSPELIVRGHGREPGPCAGMAAQAIMAVRAQYALRDDEGWLHDFVFETHGHHFVAVSENRGLDHRAYWYVTLDSNEEYKAFPAEPNDLDAMVLRDRIVAWWTWTVAGSKDDH